MKNISLQNEADVLVPIFLTVALTFLLTAFSGTAYTVLSVLFALVIFVAWADYLVKIGAFNIIIGLGEPDIIDQTLETKTSKVNKKVTDQNAKWTPFFITMGIWTAASLGIYHYAKQKGFTIILISALLFAIFLLLENRKLHKKVYPDIDKELAEVYGEEMQLQGYTSSYRNFALYIVVVLAILLTLIEKGNNFVTSMKITEICAGYLLVLLTYLPNLPYRNYTMDWRYPPIQFYLRYRFGNNKAMHDALFPKVTENNS